MLKLLGSIGVFCALTWCGIDRSRWYRRRVECLRVWHTALLEGERMLCDLGFATPDYLKQMIRFPQLAPMARHCLILLEQDACMEQAWKSGVEAAQFPLAEEETNALAELGDTLGRYDPEQQRKAIRVQRSRLEDYIVRAADEKIRLGRMWTVLGLSGGALAVVLLY